MGNVVFHMTMSLDGFVAGPNDGPENGLGDGGAPLFNWYSSGDTKVPIEDGHMVLKVSALSAEMLKEALANSGAGVWGRKTFDIAHAWGGHPPGTPCFILTHHPPPEWVYEGSPFTFVTDGIESAIRQARQASGEKNVQICTATTLQQGLKAGLVDEIHVSVAPYLLGAGVRLFDLMGGQPIALALLRVVDAPGVTHLSYRVVK